MADTIGHINALTHLAKEPGMLLYDEVKSFHYSRIHDI